MHTNETKDKFIELRLKGVSLADIAKKIGVSKTTLVDWNQKYAEEIRSLRSAELESLHDRILQSYEADFIRLSRMQVNVERLAHSEDYKLWMLDAVRGGQIVRRQIRELRKDIESFGRIINDSKKQNPTASKSETSNVQSEPASQPNDSTLPSTTSVDKT